MQVRISYAVVLCVLLVGVTAVGFFELVGIIRTGINIAECAVGSCEAFRNGDYATGVKDMVKAALDATIVMGLARKLDRTEAVQDFIQGSPVGQSYAYPPLQPRSRSHHNYTMDELHIKQSDPMSIAIYEAYTGNSGPHHIKRDTMEWPDVKYVQDDGHFEINLVAAPDNSLGKRQLEFAVYNRISIFVQEYAEGNWDIASDEEIDDIAAQTAGALSTSGGEEFCGRHISEDEQGTAYWRMRMRHISTDAADISLGNCDDNAIYEM